MAKATHFKFSMHIQKLSGHSYKALAHRAVIFAIAQLCCIIMLLAYRPILYGGHRDAAEIRPFIRPS